MNAFLHKNRCSRRLALALAGLWALGSACELDIPRALGPTCLGNGECAEGRVCYRGQCLLAVGDDDGDRVPNGVEVTFGMNPLSPDSDADGVPDFIEMGTDLENPSDEDGDGLINAIESLMADADGDCLPDQQDAQNDVPLTRDQEAQAVQAACKDQGVCADQQSVIRWNCKVENKPDGCDYSAVTDYDVDPQLYLYETLCDLKDNDCDGLTDEWVERFTWRCPQEGVCAAYQGDLEDLQGVCDAENWPCATPGPAPCTCGPDDLVCAFAVWFCLYPVDLPDYEPGQEKSCDHLDNDCDGRTDEDFPYFDLSDPDLTRLLHVGEPCGVGACQDGTVVCKEDGKHALCSTLTQIGYEFCDGLDNDCDGQTDEDSAYYEPTDVDQQNPIAMGQPCTGYNECGQGQVECLDLFRAGCSINPGGSQYPCPYRGICQLLPPGQTLLYCAGQDPPVCNFDVLSDIEDLPGPWVEEETGADCDFVDNDCDGQQDEGAVLPFMPPGGPLDLGEPSDRSGAAMAYLQSESRYYLFGGRTQDWTGYAPARGYLYDLWSAAASPSKWGGDWQWRAVLPEEQAGWPGPRQGARLAAHPTLSELYMFGGRTLPSQPDDPEIDLAELWHWDAGDGANPSPTAIALVAGDTPPPAVAFHAQILVTEPASNAGLWIVGGERADGTLHEQTVRIDPATGEVWLLPLEGLPARSHHAMVADGGRAMVFGGRDADGTLPSDVLLVDLETLAVESVPTAAEGPVGRSDTMLAVDADQGHVWMFGGQDANGQLLADLWRFDLDQHQWEPIAQDGDWPAARADGVLFMQGGYLWLAGGNGPDGRMVRDRWRLSVESLHWVPAEKHERPAPRVGAASVLMPELGQWYVFGGTAATAEGFIPLTDMWSRSVLDTPPGGWQRVTGIESDHAPVAAAVGYDPVGRRFVGYGGFGLRDGKLNAQAASQVVWTYDVLLNHWETTDGGWVVGPPALRLLAGDYVPTLQTGGLLTVGGALSDNDAATDEIWLYQPDGGIWSALQPELAFGSPPRPARTGHQAVYDSLRNRLYVIGGGGPDGYLGVYDIAANQWQEMPAPGLTGGLTLCAFLDRDSGQLLTLQTAGVDQWPAWARTDVSEGGLGQPLPFDSAAVFMPLTPVGAAQFYNPIGRAAMLFGGVGLDGSASNMIWGLGQECPAPPAP